MPMTRRWFLLILLLLLLLGSLLLVPSVRWPVYGWLRGEAFYQGKPTSYWSQKIRILGEAWRSGNSASPSPLADRFHSIFQSGDIYTEEQEAVALFKDPSALPVLLALLKDESPVVRSAGVYLLDKTGLPADTMVPVLL